MAPSLVVAAVFGLLIGSFLNVVAWRLPRGESLVRPRSKCPGCNRQLAAYDNIPVLSWLVLRGKCRNCRQPISVRYPLIEALTAGLYVAVVAGLWGDERKIALGLALVTVLVPIAVIDLDVRRIPNPLVIAGSVAALVIGLALGIDKVPEQLIAGTAALFFFLLPALVHQKGMGMGDVKLVGMLGLYLGRGVAPAILIALALGTIVGIGIVLVKGISDGRRTKVPFGPFLAVAAVVCLFAGDAIVDGYLDRF